MSVGSYEIRGKASGLLIRHIRFDDDASQKTACQKAEKERQRWLASDQFPAGVYVREVLS